MAISNVALENRIDFLAQKLRRLEQKVCCTSGGLTIVTTDDSATVSFTGTGAIDDPLTATATDPRIATNVPLGSSVDDLIEALIAAGLMEP